MNEDNVAVNSLRAWVLAARPKTLTAAAVPVMIGVALHEVNGLTALNALPVVLCFLFAFILQIDANFVNDYFDYLKGTDGEERLGPRRACAQGWVTLPAMRWAIGWTTVLGCFAGLPLIFYGGWEMIGVGLACVVFCFLYTTCLSYVGMGDVLVVLFFGLVPVCATYYVIAPEVAQSLNAQVVWASLACGIVVDALLLVNNYRDIENDRLSGKKTLVVRLGTKATEMVYLLTGYTSCAIFFFLFIGQSLMAALLPLLYLVPHTLTFIEMRRIAHGHALNKVLGMTARNILLFGLLSALGLLLGSVV